MLRCLTWLVALVGTAAHARFPRPEKYNFEVLCSSWPGTCSEISNLEHCAAENRVCYNAVGSNLACCCDHSVLPPIEDGQSKAVNRNGSCVYTSCLAKVVQDRKMMPSRCGDGCCFPGNHGTVHKCGRSLQKSKKTKRHESCCISAESDEEQQRDAGCCAADVGIDCYSPYQNESCCLSPSTAMGPDLSASCQRETCSGVKNCSHGYGYDCLGRPGHPHSRGKKKCCLSHDGTPSPHDPCQKEAHDCLLTSQGGRFEPCDDDYGIDCFSEPHKACCLSGQFLDQCRRQESCGKYWTERVLLIIAVIIGSVLCLISLACSLRCLWWRLLRCWQRCPWNRSSTLLCASGHRVHLHDLPVYSKRVALIVTCQHYYRGYQGLEASQNAGNELAQLLQEELGYHHVLHLADATRKHMREAFKKLLQWVQGSSDVLFVVYFSGHGCSFHGELLWAGVDSSPSEKFSHLNIHDLCGDLENIHMRKVAQEKFQCNLPVSRATFVFLGDCCRSPIAGSQDELRTQHQAAPRSILQSWHPSSNRSKFAFFYVTDHGKATPDCARSPFLESLKVHLLEFLPLSSLLQKIDEDVRREAPGRRVWLKECTGEVAGACLRCPLEEQCSNSRRQSIESLASISTQASDERRS